MELLLSALSHALSEYRRWKTSGQTCGCAVTLATTQKEWDWRGYDAPDCSQRDDVSRVCSSITLVSNTVWRRVRVHKAWDWLRRRPGKLRCDANSRRSGNGNPTQSELLRDNARVVRGDAPPSARRLSRIAQRCRGRTGIVRPEKNPMLLRWRSHHLKQQERRPRMQSEGIHIELKVLHQRGWSIIQLVR